MSIFSCCCRKASAVDQGEANVKVETTIIKNPKTMTNQEQKVDVVVDRLRSSYAYDRADTELLEEQATRIIIKVQTLFPEPKKENT